jgi:hypothetical protein
VGSDYWDDLTADDFVLLEPVTVLGQELTAPPALPPRPALPRLSCIIQNFPLLQQWAQTMDNRVLGGQSTRELDEKHNFSTAGKHLLSAER